MFLVTNKAVTDPAMNLALEEYCLRSLDPGRDYVLLYINQPSIIIGRHQNPLQEFDQRLARQKEILLVRRISGGGAVYHDLGNLNFSFITDFTETKLDYVKTLLTPILKTLQRLGVAAQLTEKNNIVVDAHKVSGNSQHTNMRRVLSHGTLLYDSELDVLRRLLQTNLVITKSRAVQSIRARVANISEYLRPRIGIEAFRTEIKKGISDAFGELIEYRLTARQREAVCRLANEKYKSWDWTFGRSPEFAVHHKFGLDSGDIDAQLIIKNGIIKDIQLADQSAEAPAVRKIVDEFIGQKVSHLEL